MELNQFNTEARPQKQARITLPGWYLALWATLVAIIDSVNTDEVDAISTKVGSWSESDEGGNYSKAEDKAKLSVFVKTTVWERLVDAFCKDQASEDGVCEFGPKSTPKSGAKALLAEFIKKTIVPEVAEKINLGEGEKIIPVIYIGDKAKEFKRLVDGGELKATNPAARSSRKAIDGVRKANDHSGLRGKVTVS
jgi:hypothetical protein